GESAVVRCPSCGYAANTEKAETKREEAEAVAVSTSDEPFHTVPTPGHTSVEEVAKFLGVEPTQVVKTLIYETEKGVVAVAIRGDREVNEVKLLNLLDVQHLALASEEKVRQATGAP